LDKQSFDNIDNWLAMAETFSFPNTKFLKIEHLKKCAHQSHLGRQKMGWFLAD
jgi:hypothetical protein